jgi:potassium channel subfamily K protein
MPKRHKDGTDKKADDIAALEAVLTQAILHEVKVKQMEKPKLVQIVIYESSV